MQSWPSPPVPALPGNGPALRLHDTARGQVVDVTPRAAARLYVCGITPYDATHLGHAATYIAFDLAQRIWRDGGHEVRYVQNVTDVDDPLLERAAATGVAWTDLAERETELFRTDMSALRVLAPDLLVGVVESIDVVSRLVEQLRQRGVTYELDGDVYCDARADAAFGQVGGYDDQTMRRLSGERGGDPDRPGKRDAVDPLLWQAERPGEPGWDSPLGRGRPGWHAECSALAAEHLGMGFDVQGGGSDLVFPHHEMSATQAQLATGEHPFAKAYVHAGMVGFEGHKMSKSRGNLVLVSALRDAGVDPMAIRLALLAHHYRSDWEWTDADLDQAIERLACWRSAVGSAEAPRYADEVLTELRAAMADDLDAPRALACLDRWAGGVLSNSSAQGDAATGVGPGPVRACVRTAVDALLGVAL
jgi:L-cysteine:1D-myo-inositol 2-amino-2-deoxy-alpha-D-glucopyranoside ligase